MQKKSLFSSQKGFRRCLSFFIFCLVAFSSIVTSAMADELSSSLLQDLQDAIVTGKYHVKLLKRNNSKGTQKVILLGESYFKDQVAERIGEKITSHFKLIAVEGDMKRARFVNEHLKAYEFARTKYKRIQGDLYPPFSETLSKAYCEYLLKRDPLEKVLMNLLHQSLTLFEMDKENFISNFEPFKLSDLVNENLKKFLVSLGFSENTQFNRKKAENLMFKVKKELFKNHFELIRLEDFDPLPNQILELESKVRFAKKCTDLSLSCCYFASLAFVGHCFFPELISTSAACPFYVISALSVFNALNQVGKIDFNQMIAPRSKILAKRISGAMDFRSYADAMLVIVNKSYFEEVFKILLSQYEWKDDASGYQRSQ